MSNGQPDEKESKSVAPSRRGFLAAAYGLAAAASADFGLRAARGAISSPGDTGARPAPAPATIDSFYGEHQGGILSPVQKQTYFASFDLTTSNRDEVIRMLRDWTSAAALMTAGQTDGSLTTSKADDATTVKEAAIEVVPPPPATQSAENSKSAYGSGDAPRDASTADSGEVLGLSPSRLTLTFGFGAGLFIKDGKDRYGVAARRPAELMDLPRFNGDQLVEQLTGGDISVQACADDPQVAFHAVRRLARHAEGVAKVRWAQTGFLPNSAPGQTPRNLMGFKDGTSNVSPADPAGMDKFVWVGGEGPDWMRGGSYLVVRRIRMALEHWDQMKVGFQQQTFGRYKVSGAPLGGKNELDTPDLDAADKDGNSIIPDNSHVRLAIAASNDGARIFRRPYSYNDGANFTSERWPPWRQGIEFDAGLLFICYQRDPRTGFVKIFDNMSKLDLLNQFVTHTGGGLFACPAGIEEGQYIGEPLFRSA